MKSKRLKNIMMTAAIVLGLGSVSTDVISQTTDDIHDTFTLTSRPFAKIAEQSFIQQWFLYNANITVSFVQGDTFSFDKEKNVLELGTQTPIHTIPAIIQTMSDNTYDSYQTTIDLLTQYYEGLDSGGNTTIDRASIEQYLGIIPTDSTTIADQWNIQSPQSKIDSIQLLVAPEIYSMFTQTAFEQGAKKLTGVDELKDVIERDALTQEYNSISDIHTKTSYAKSAIEKLLDAIEQTNLHKNTNQRQTDFFLESTATNIINHQDIACVGLSTIVHEFLGDMGIEHEAIIHKNHVALVVTFPDGSSLFCDPLKDGKNGLTKMHLETLDPHGSQITVANESYLVLTENADDVLMSTIAFNDAYRISTLTDKNLVATKINLLKKAIEFQPKNFVAYRILANLLFSLERYEEAYTYSKKSIELMPHEKQYLKKHMEILIKLPSNKQNNQEKFTTMQKINNLQ